MDFISEIDSKLLNIEPDECWFNASVIKDVYAKIENGISHLRCPYCGSLNKLPDDNIGYRICGACEQIFNVK